MDTDHIENKRSGFRVSFIRSTAVADQGHLQMMASYAPFSFEPPAHFHPFQKEEFKILQGMMNVRMGAKIHQLAKGDMISIPAGQEHSMWNPGKKEAIVDWKVSPPMQTEKFLREITQIANGPKVDKNGIPSPIRAIYFFSRFGNTVRLTGPAAWAVDLLAFLRKIFH